jgi:flagellar basal-body rod protein FlgB
VSDRLLDPTIGALNTSLNLRLMNQNVIASNIANADTPNYKAKAMEFESAFREALQSGDDLGMQRPEEGHMGPSAIDAIHPEIYEVPNGVESLDGNTVNRSEEMTKMAENQMMYETGIELLRRKLGMLKYAVNDGGAK